MIHPLTLGHGKKTFGDDAAARAFTLVENVVTSTGVIMAHYTRDGDVATGAVGG